jgi:iron complex transport system substrate-binding protein
MGPVELPVDPKRLVAVYATDIDVALALGLPLIGGGTARGTGGDEPFASYQPEEELEDVEPLATYPEANYEQIAAVDPDCIIDSTPPEGDRYERFSEIAPTFNYSELQSVGEDFRSDWKGGFRGVARAFGKEALAERGISAYEDRAAGIKDRLAERWGGASFAFVGSYEPATVWVSDKGMHLDQIAARDLGLTPSEVVPETYNERPNLSLERLDLLEDTDILFVRIEPSRSGPGRDRKFIGPVQESPLWQRLPAVRKGQVVEYDAELFYASPLTAEAFLGVVERSLLS